jgi:hypothetical protein
MRMTLHPAPDPQALVELGRAPTAAETAAVVGLDKAEVMTG